MNWYYNAGGPGLWLSDLGWPNDAYSDVAEIDGRPVYRFPPEVREELERWQEEYAAAIRDWLRAHPPPPEVRGIWERIVAGLEEGEVPVHSL